MAELYGFGERAIRVKKEQLPSTEFIGLKSEFIKIVDGWESPLEVNLSSLLGYIEKTKKIILIEDANCTDFSFSYLNSKGVMVTIKLNKNIIGDSYRSLVVIKNGVEKKWCFDYDAFDSEVVIEPKSITLNDDHSSYWRGFSEKFAIIKLSNKKYSLTVKLGNPNAASNNGENYIIPEEAELNKKLFELERQLPLVPIIKIYEMIHEITGIDLGVGNIEVKICKKNINSEDLTFSEIVSNNGHIAKLTNTQYVSSENILTVSLLEDETVVISSNGDIVYSGDLFGLKEQNINVYLIVINQIHLSSKIEKANGVIRKH